MLAILAAAVGVWMTVNTSYHQLAIGITVALIALGATLGVVELIYRFGVYLFGGWKS